MPGEYACVAPIYGRKRKVSPSIAAPKDCKIILDSGAFSDSTSERLTFDDALKRQLSHASKKGYWDRVTHVASYDLLIDEMWQDGEREKRRWDEESAWKAVEETVAAAAYLSKERRKIGNRGAILSVQGVTPSQYMECARAIVPHLHSNDILGMGGWCISGLRPKEMLGSFSETITSLVPFAHSNGVKRIHIWGVMDSEFLGQLLWICDRYGILPSTDSVGPHMRPARNGQWGYRGWVKEEYKRAPTNQRGLHRAIHVMITRCWLNCGLRNSVFYREPTGIRLKRKDWR